MRINEVIQKVDLSKRAVKFYEEKGLLKVLRDANGYRNYSEEDVQRLKEISVYRKLGIELSDIHILLEGKNKELLKQIYEQKQSALHARQAELEALKRLIEDHDVDAAYEAVDYETVGKAMQDMFPGFYGYYFMYHFQPYLQIQITTPEQKEAYETILRFWDQAKIKVPLFFRLSGYLMYRLTPPASAKQMTAQMDRTLQMYLHPTEEEYTALCKKTRQAVKTKKLMKYHPAFISQRRFMKRLKDSGYYDIFIPAMKRLSPAYRTYQEALMQINARICEDLGLYYDSDYNLVMEKEKLSI